jgi:UDP-perosamine 4-acetyltransferase
MDRTQRADDGKAVQAALKDVILIGGGGHARVVICILKKLKGEIRGYTDRKTNEKVLGVPFLGSDDEIEKLLTGSETMSAVIAVGQVGSGKHREAIWRRLCSLDLLFPSVVSPDAVVNEDVVIGDATVVMDGAIINTGARLGIGVIANTHATIEHDVTLGDWVHVAPGATISGGVNVGRCSMIGVGATVIEGRSIAGDTIVGAGATVVRDITEPGVYVGTPARRIR